MEQGGQGCSWMARQQLVDQRQTTKPRAPAQGNKASNHLVKTPVGVEAAAGETPSLTEEFVGETNRALEHTQAHTPRNQHQKAPI